METSKRVARGAATDAETNRNPVFPSESNQTAQCTTATTAASAAQYLTAKQIAILEARGINIELAEQMGWRNGRNGSGEIEIPYFKNAVEVNCKTRTIEGEKKFYQVAGGEKCFYNVDLISRLKEDDALVITEGEMDCLIALQCGYSAISVPDGAPKEAIGDKESVKYNYLSDIPKNLKRIVLATDGDAPGVNLMNDLALRLGKHRCMWVSYPQGCKDLNDAFLKYGKRGVDAVFERARYFDLSGLYRLSELPPLAEQTPIDVCIPKLENNFRLRTGDFSVVTGIPSHGKSTFVNHVAYNIADKHGWNICFASFEQPPQTEHLRALSTLHNRKPYWQQTSEEKWAAMKWIENRFSFIVPPDDSDDWADMSWLKDRMAAAVTRHNCKMIVIDPWNELDHVYNQREISLTQYVGMAIKDLKRFARKFNVHMMVIAHPAKLRRDSDGDYPIPTAYDISDSAHWANKPEQIVIVHRNADNTLIRVAKSRYHYALGKPGDVELNYDEHTQRYS